MAIIWVREIRGREGLFDASPVRDYRRIFQVLTDTPLTHADQVRDAAGMPLIGDAHPRDSGSVVQRIIPRQVDEKPELWDVIVEYSSRSSQGGISDSNPLDRPPRFDWSTRRRTIPVVKTRFGCNDSQSFVSQAIANSAGEPFDPPPLINESNMVLRITRNEAFFDPDGIESLLNCTNLEEFQGFEACSWLFTDVTSTRSFEGDNVFDTVTYTFERDIGGWQLELLDQGYYEKASGKLKPARDETENALPSKPVLLDGNGVKLALGSNPVFLDFNVYEAKSFAPLNLPNYSTS